jgi:hypothetical protein
MPKATDFTVFSGTLADADHLILLDASETLARKDKLIAVDHARKQLVRAHTSSSDPTVSDDDTEGFVAGNLWLNTSDGGVFVLVDASTGAADWDEFGSGGGASAFTDLTDAPSDYTGQGGKLVAVNSGATALEFITPATLDAADLTSGVATDGHVLTADGAGGAAWEAVPSGGSPDWGDIGGTLSSQTDLYTALLQSFVIACSDETSDLTTGDAKVTFRMPYAFTVTGVKASVTTAPTGAAISVDIREAGTTILSTPITIDATELTSASATTPAVVSDASLAADAEIKIDIDAVGSSIAGAGLKVTITGRPA